MPYDFEADALLLRAMLGTAAHDLGGVASALALRADVVASTLPPGDVAAIRGVAEHVRSLGRQLRRLRGTAGGSNLAPARERTLTEWVALLERFGGPTLGRGIELRASCNEGPLSAATEQCLTYGMLALFTSLREAREAAAASGVVVTLRADSTADALELTLRVTWGADAPAWPLADRWWAHSREVVTSGALEWDESDGGVVRIVGRP